MRLHTTSAVDAPHGPITRLCSLSKEVNGHDSGALTCRPVTPGSGLLQDVSRNPSE